MLIEVVFSDAYARTDVRLLEIDDAVWAKHREDIYKFCHEATTKCYSYSEMICSIESHLAHNNIEYRWLNDDVRVVLNAISRRPPMRRLIRYSGWKRDLKDFFKDPNTARIWHCENEVDDFLKHCDGPTAAMFAEKILDTAYKIDDDGVYWELGFDPEDLMLHSIYRGKENKEEK